MVAVDDLGAGFIRWTFSAVILSQGSLLDGYDANGATPNTTGVVASDSLTLPYDPGTYAGNPWTMTAALTDITFVGGGSLVDGAGTIG